MPSVYIGTPKTKPLADEYVQSLWGSRIEGESAWTWVKNRPVDEGRNELAEKFKRHEQRYDFLLMADADAMWHPNAIERLMSHNLPVVTGCIYRRKLPPIPTVGIYKGISRKSIHVYDFSVVTKAIVDYADRVGITTESSNILCMPEPELMEVDGCGMHFCLIRRDVIEAVEPPWFKRNYAGAGEDFYFCRKVKEAGFGINLELSVHTGHVCGDDFIVGIKELLAFINHTTEVAGEKLAALEEVPM